MVGKLLNREEPRIEDTEVEELKPMERLDEMEPNKRVKEKHEETLKSRMAVSPVIATVILVAVTITVAVAVAYWMSGIAGQYTQFEKIEIQSGYATKTYSGTPLAHDGWTVLITLKNSGTSTATLINVFLNDQIIGVSGAVGLTGVTAVGTLGGVAAGSIGASGDTGITINSGETVEVTITKVLLAFSSSGTTVNVKLHSAAGMDYIRLLQWP